MDDQEALKWLASFDEERRKLIGRISYDTDVDAAESWTVRLESHRGTGATLTEACASLYDAIVAQLEQRRAEHRASLAAIERYSVHLEGIRRPE